MLSLAVLSAFLVPLSQALPICHSHTQPNPIASVHPNDATGVINGTTAIVPIPYNIARQIVPAQYAILTSAYHEIFPGLPSNIYPAVLEAVQDHDVQQSGIGIPDFTRMALKFPFIDRLKDGYSSFKYTPPQLISVENLVAVIGSGFYGKTVPATFDPACEAYKGTGQRTTSLNGYAVPKSSALGFDPDIASSFQEVGSIPYDLKAFVNVTNQPLFGDGLPLCDNYITLYNTSVTEGQYAPVPVRGNLNIQPPFYPTVSTFESVYGYRMANAFVEKNGIPCENLRGYAGTDPGDT